MVTVLEKLASFCDPGVTPEVLDESITTVTERIKRGAYGHNSEEINPVGHTFVRYVADKWWYPLSKWRSAEIDKSPIDRRYPSASTMSGEEILDMLAEFINATMGEEKNG